MFIHPSLSANPWSKRSRIFSKRSKLAILPLPRAILTNLFLFFQLEFNIEKSLNPANVSFQCKRRMPNFISISFGQYKTSQNRFIDDHARKRRKGISIVKFRWGTKGTTNNRDEIHLNRWSVITLDTGSDRLRTSGSVSHSRDYHWWRERERDAQHFDGTRNVWVSLTSFLAIQITENQMNVVLGFLHIGRHFDGIVHKIFTIQCSQTSRKLEISWE